MPFGPYCSSYLCPLPLLHYGFQLFANFPNCLGAIDAKHIRVKQPPNSGTSFFSYKKYFSVVLMAICDADYNFILIDVGAYGSTGDSRVLENSAFGQTILKNHKSFPKPKPLPGTATPLPFVCDEAFKITTHQLRPYSRRGLHVRKRIYNLRLSRARRKVECAFGILTRQWRVFHSPLQLHFNIVDCAIKAACVLHNFMRKHGMSGEGLRHAEEGANLPSYCLDTCHQLSGLGIREAYASYFVSAEGGVGWQYFALNE